MLKHTSPQADAREARVKSLATDGSEIRYRVYGSGEPAIVFIHGWSCDSGYWDCTEFTGLP